MEALGKEAASWCLVGSPAGDTQAHRALWPSEKIYFSLVGRMKHPGEERGFCAYSHKSSHKSSLSAACGTMAPSSLTQMRFGMWSGEERSQGQA